ncbi:hypothetical protein KKA95_03715 [Patescibacteria group bacterium]|nr:hypothetical protein [Patescibacteria group bacterium]
MDKSAAEKKTKIFDYEPQEGDDELIITEQMKGPRWDRHERAAESFPKEQLIFLIRNIFLNTLSPEVIERLTRPNDIENLEALDVEILRIIYTRLSVQLPK